MTQPDIPDSSNRAYFIEQYPDLADVFAPPTKAIKSLATPTPRKAKRVVQPMPLKPPERAEERKVMKFTIQGEPIGAPRMTRRDKWKKRPCVERYFAWKDSARAAAGVLPMADHIESLSWTAYFEPPQSWSKLKRTAVIETLHRSKPDRDNIDKAVLDALFERDAAIARGTIQKLWDWTPRLEVEIVWY